MQAGLNNDRKFFLIEKSLRTLVNMVPVPEDDMVKLTQKEAE